MHSSASRPIPPVGFSRCRPGLLLALAVLLLGGCAGQRGLPLVSATAPVYPPQAREAGTEGYVVVRYDVDREGRVVNARVVDAQPEGIFEDSALQAISRWRFRQPEDDAEASTVTGLESRLEFTVEGGSRYEDY